MSQASPPTRIEPVNATDKTLIVRHNTLIESAHTLDLNQRRFVEWMIGEIRPEDEELKRYRISVSDFGRICGLKPSNSHYQMIIDLADRLTRCNVGLAKSNGKRGKAAIRYVPWFYAVEYKPGEGAIEAQLHPELKPLVLQLNAHFTAVERKIALSIRGDYAARFYQWLKQYQTIGHRILTIEWIRERCELTPDQYTNFADFKRRVIEPAQKELARHSDIAFSWEPHERQRKKVISITCHIRANHPAKAPAALTDKHHDPVQRLTQLGVHPISVAEELVGTFRQAHVAASIRYFEQQKAAGKANSAGFLIRAIRENWVETHAPLASKSLSSRLETTADIQENNDNKRRETFWTCIDAMPSKQRVEVERAFATKMADKPFFKPHMASYQTTGEMNPLLRGMFYTLMAEEVLGEAAWKN